MTVEFRAVSDLVDPWLRKQWPEGAVAPDTDDIAAFEMVSVADLVVDPHYQRALSAKGRSTIAKVIADFDWLKFGAISVARRGDKLTVIDGQHRAVAAAAIGIAMVPAMVATVAAAEAATFVAIKDVRTSVTPTDKFRAKVAAGDRAAVELSEVLQELGISADVMPGIPLKARQTRAISALYKAIGAHGRGIVFTALEMLIDGQEDNPDALTSLNITAVCDVTAQVISGGGDIDRLARVIEEADFEQIAESSRSLQKIAGGAQKGHAASLILREYDKGLKANRLSQQKGF